MAVANDLADLRGCADYAELTDLDVFKNSEFHK